MGLSFFPETPKFYAIVLTNEQGSRSYLYILKFQDRFDLNDRVMSGICLINGMNNFGRVIYLPIGICILSSISNVDFFKKLLTEMYNVISLSVDSKLNQDIVKKFQMCELYNYIIFISSILCPPPSSKMTINLSKRL